MYLETKESWSTTNDSINDSQNKLSFSSCNEQKSDSISSFRTFTDCSSNIYNPQIRHQKLSIKLSHLSGYSQIGGGENDQHIDQTYYESIGYIKLFRRFFTEMQIKERHFLYFSLFCIVFRTILQLIFYLFIADIIDLVGDYENYQGSIHLVCDIHVYLKPICNIHVFMVTLIIICLLLSLLKYVENVSTCASASAFLITLNCNVFDKVINQNLAFFNKTEKTSTLNKVLSNDMENIDLSIHKMMTTIENITHFVCGIIYLFIINWNMGLIIICNFILFLVISIVYIKKNMLVEKLRSSKFRVVVIKICEMVNYITTIKTFSKEDDEAFLFNRCIKAAYECHINRNLLLNKYNFWLDILIYLTVLIIMWYGSVLIIADNSTMRLGTLTMDLYILLQLNRLIKKILRTALLFSETYLQSARKIYVILDIEEEENDIVIVPCNKEIVGAITMKNVRFAYPKRIKKLVLQNICLHFEPASLTALVGVSGCGKSSILKLLMRFFDPQKGEILVDNVDIKKYNLLFLRSNIGYVGQDVKLFQNRSIAENIKFPINYGFKHFLDFDDACFDDGDLISWRQRKTVQDKDIENAARIANAYKFIKILGKNNKENKKPQYWIIIKRNISDGELKQEERARIIKEIENVSAEIIDVMIVKGDIKSKIKSNVLLISVTSSNDKMNTNEIEELLAEKLNVCVEMKQKCNYFQIGSEMIIGGADGIQLSHGEKQRIAIARAVLLNPKILLLDEAMSHLDPISKDSIQHALNRIMMEKNRSVVVIAHRLSTVQNAKMIYVVNKGMIDDYGTHDELIKKENGLYFKLLQRQTFV